MIESIINYFYWIVGYKTTDDIKKKQKVQKRKNEVIEMKKKREIILKEKHDNYLKSQNKIKKTCDKDINECKKVWIKNHTNYDIFFIN